MPKQQQKELTSLIQDIYSYNHTKGEDIEYLRLTPVKRESIEKGLGADSYHPLGYCLSKIYECIPLIKAFGDCSERKPEVLLSALAALFTKDEDFPLYNVFLRQLILTEHLSHMLIRDTDLAKSQLYNMYEYITLCCQDVKYCNLEALSVFASISAYPLKGPDVLVAVENFSFSELRDYEIKSYIDNALQSKSNLHIFNSYNYITSSDICFASLYEIFSEGKVIKKCGNCGKVFVPLNKADTKYCTNTSPQYSNRTCREAMKYIKQQERLSNNDLERMHKLAYNTIRNRLNSKKAVDNAGVCAFYEKHLRDFTEESRNMRQRVLDGEMSKEDYIRWLNEAKKKKV